LLIDREHWEWAKAVVLDEYSKINDVVALTSGSDVMDELVYYVSIKMASMITGTMKNNQFKVDTEMRKAGMTPVSYLKKACKANKMFAELEGDPKYSGQYKSGFDKVIDYMVKSDYLERIKTHKFSRGSAYKALPNLIELVEGMNK